MELGFPHHYEALGDRTLCVTPTTNSAPTPFCCRILPRPGEKTWPRFGHRVRHHPHAVVPPAGGCP